MISTDFKSKVATNTFSVTIITENTDCSIREKLAESNFKVQCMESIPQEISLWKESPNAILIDTSHRIKWELFLQSLKEIEEYKDVPVILLLSERISIKEAFTILDQGVFSYAYKDNYESIVKTLTTAIKYWFDLRDSLIKTNQLNRILSTNYLNIDSKNEYLEKVKKKIDSLTKLPGSEISKELNSLSNEISKQLKQGYHHDLFKAHFEEVHPLFYKKLLQNNKNLTSNDLKLASFIKMGFNNSEISFFLGISMAGVKKAIQRIKVRLSIAPKESLRQFVFNIDV
ncbi:hypothetical protein [Tenacibaculum sp. 190524A05c]|uniref:DNA-binding NarL/FixJ family response regulator n=1 Tax=Tenacibaculum platacis TaxID=3137852 RepID=A0ABP1EVA5_9FLAO